METIEELKAELEKERERYARLEDRDSHYKEDYQAQIEKTQREFYRSIVCEYLLRFLNDINPWWTPEDLTKEIDLNSEKYFNWWKTKRQDLIREDMEKHPLIKETFRHRMKWGMDHPVEAGLTKET